MRAALKRLLFGTPQEAYLLRDDFTDTLAAGSVDGTLAVPGPGGLRAATDTEGRLTQSGGLSVFAGGKTAPGWGDPGRWWPAQVRTAGKLLLSSVKLSDVTYLKRMLIGFSDTTSGAGTNGKVASLSFNSTDGANIAFGGGGLFSLGTVVIDTTYQIAIALRDTGCFYFIKGGLWTNWTMLYYRQTDNTTPLYPYISNHSALINSDLMRVPLIAWLPTPLVSDGMSSATLTDGAGHAETTGIGSGGGNVPWATAATWAVGDGVATNTPSLGVEQNSRALVVGTWYKITATQANYFYAGCAINDTFCASATTALDANNKVRAMVTAELFRCTTVSQTPDVIAQVTIPAMAAERTQAGLAIRLDSPTTPTAGILIYFNYGLRVYEFNGAGYTLCLASNLTTFTAGCSLKVIATGSHLQLLHITSAGVVTEIGSSDMIARLTGSYSGLLSTVPGNQLDNFVVYPIGTGGEYNILNRFANP